MYNFMNFMDQLKFNFRASINENALIILLKSIFEATLCSVKIIAKFDSTTSLINDLKYEF